MEGVRVYLRVWTLHVIYNLTNSARWHSLSVWQTDRPYRLWDTHTHIVFLNLSCHNTVCGLTKSLSGRWRGQLTKRWLQSRALFNQRTALKSHSVWTEKPFLCEDIFVRRRRCLKVYFSRCHIAKEYTVIQICCAIMEWHRVQGNAGIHVTLFEQGG